MEDRIGSLIRSLAKLRIRIDKTPHQALRDSFEAEFGEKLLELERFTPAEQKRSIDELIDREIARIDKENLTKGKFDF